MFCIMFCYALVSLTYICNHMTYSCIYVYVYVSTLFIWCILMSLCNSVMSCLRFMFLVNLSFQDAGLGRVGHQQTVGGNFIPPKVLRTRPSWVGWIQMRPGHAVQYVFSYMQQFLKCRGTKLMNNGNANHMPTWISPLSARWAKREGASFDVLVIHSVLHYFRIWFVFKFEMLYVVLPLLIYAFDATTRISTMFNIWIRVYMNTRAMPFVCEGQGQFIR